MQVARVFPKLSFLRIFNQDAFLNSQKKDSKSIKPIWGLVFLVIRKQKNILILLVEHLVKRILIRDP